MLARECSTPNTSHKLLGYSTSYDVALTCQHYLNSTTEIQGVTIQRMVFADQGFAMSVGAKKDATFGPVILLDAGSVATELFRDTALNLPPVNEALVRQRLESLPSWPLLRGFRGRPAVNVTRLIETVLGFTALVCENPRSKKSISIRCS